MRADELPRTIWNALGVDPHDVTGIAESALSGGTGAASGLVGLITLTLGTAWLAERSLPLPSGYVEFVCAHLP